MSKVLAGNKAHEGEDVDEGGVDWAGGERQWPSLL